MTDFVNNWNNELLTTPVAPLGLIAMPGCEEMGKLVNGWLMKWHEQQEALEDTPLYSLMGSNRSDFLIEARCPRFGTGEGKGMVKSTVRGYDIYILTDVGAYNKTYQMYGKEVPMSPDDHFQDLKRIIGAIGGRAKRINVIMPYLYEGRQHRRSTRESLDCAQALQDLQNLGVSNFITFDAHDPRIQNAVPLMGFDSVRPSYQILKALFRKDKDLQLDREHMMIVSPDEGALDRNIFFSSVLGLDMGMFYKRRDYTRIVDGKNPIVAHEFLGTNVEGKDVIIIDDMISSGDSILDVARELKRRKARKVYAAATFGLFTNGLAKFDAAYEQGIIDHILTTNLVYQRPELLSRPYYVNVDLSKYIALLIDNLNHNVSIHGLLNPTDRINRILEKHRAAQAQKAAENNISEES